MKITKSDGSFFKLNIVGYEFPANEHDYWDANWLVLRIRAYSRGRTWLVKNPCLTTFEVERLISWLKNISSNTINGDSPDFLEPVINFQLSVDQKGDKCLKVKCLHPTRRKIMNRVKHLVIRFPAKRINFEALIADLQGQLDRFPQRVFRQPIQLEISGLAESDAELYWTMLTAEFRRNPRIKFNFWKWDKEGLLLKARLAYEFTRNEANEEGLRLVRESIASVFGLSDKITFKISAQPIQ